MSCIGRGLNRIYLSTYEGCLAVTYGRGRDYRKVCALIFLFSKIMKKSLLLILLSIYSFTTIHAKITWTLSDDGTLTISGTDMPDYSLINNAPWDLQKYKIKKVVIKDGVTSIGSEAFFYCTGLTSVSIPNSVTSIGNSAFNYCSSLTTITIPESVTSIGSSAFYRTKWYDNQPDGVVYAGKVLYEYKGTMPSNTKIDIKEGTTQIGGYAFSDCSDLTSITIPNSVTSIGKSAFNGCSDLTSITIPNSVTSIGERAFEGCSDLTSITIPNSVTSIGESAFENCSSLTSVTIPNSVTKIEERAFYGCESLTSVTIPNSVTSIGESAFQGCRSLTSVTIPNSVTSIGKYAFYCSGLTSISIPNSVTSIEKHAFDCSSLRSIIIPNSVTKIEEGAFNYQSFGASIICEATTPPSCHGSAFNDYSYFVNVYVPANSVDQYKAAKEWKKFPNILPIQNEATDINLLRIGDSQTPVYDMNGRKVNDKNLKSGLYIKNGKKVVVK